ncbi:hypothetical protein CBR_g31445 [Chara braunii]|uniref:Myb/SANT-like DNA-binding domain-containing protein n=1 Tax=Chara braunii TaxID=69332 RepID=A0A388LEZ1_CHABU|nr:hypothetical protein CBR_g31445 [Chara braunii]|eukprot:GBG80889.1 hypothetical protein CBR_g31445 [Chara braunii]
MCILGCVSRRGRRRRSFKNDARMEGRQTISGSAGEHGGRRSGHSPSNSSRPSERSGYAHLPPHLQPMPDTSDEEAGKRIRLGVDGYRAVWKSRGRSPAPLWEASGNNKDPLRQQFRSSSVCRGASAHPHWMQSPSPLSAGSIAGRRLGECGETARGIADVRDARDGREMWAEQRRLMRSGREESITRGVQRLRVGKDGHDCEEAVADAHDSDWNDNGAEGGEDDAGYISPSKQAAAMGGRGGKTKSCVDNGRRGKRTAGKGSDAKGDVDGEGGHHFWSVDDIIALTRAKRDQDAHLQGMGHAYARMKPREWKWLDVATRLKKVGVDREADRCGKKWDNLMQQFKKVHHFQGLSGKQDFFQLSGKDRMSKGFSFNMDRAVYDEILGSTTKNHTINPKNVADTGAQGGVRLPSASFADPKSVDDRDGGAEHDDDDSTKGPSQTTGGAGDFGKKKSTRQQTFEAMTECMEKHGALMASTMESNNKRHCYIAPPVRRFIHHLGVALGNAPHPMA